MTRGTFYLISDYHYFKSCEFNGDMYPDGHGRLAKELLDRVETTQGFYKMVAYFNDINHKYTDEYPLVRVEMAKDLDKWLDMSNNYFDFWFSDWIFIKNISKKDYIFTYKQEKIEGTDEVKPLEKVTVKPSGILVINFGGKPSKEDLKELGIKD